MGQECKQVLKYAALVILGGVAAWFGCVFAAVHATNQAAALLLLTAALWTEATRTARKMSGGEKETGDTK
ncbi:MAG: hypothetical protein LUE89_00075 [Clostridiales bacterium]|nr:hypothetical protein [Clostridiales bacterium]